MNNKEIRRKIDDLKIIRDKYIAHNEHLSHTYDLNNFWDDVVLLQDIASLILRLIGRYCLSGEYFQFEKNIPYSIHYSIITECYWLVTLIEKVIGKNKIINWWAIEE
ncbi:hypothetical protein KZP23_16610 [Echinicola marina]|uniref:hypothetical protein n=1 Tax=Echinicola marina TaxID=2859768 RepID=UPI001CF60CC0|nr:hypothetical protein [Echinicola marina]UCS92312.1 hypothetical protein KZP23_16610 [Echinicola marina]